MKDDKILSEAKERFDRAARHEREMRNLGEEDLLFLAGQQWPDSVKTARQAQDRPCLTFNRLPQFVQQVVGDARQNRPSIKVNPVDSGADVETAEVYEGLIRNIEAESRATQAYITALEHSTGCGFGAWRIVTEYSSEDTFNQDIRVKRITDPFAVFWDVNAKEYDKSDAAWCFVSEWVSKESFHERWPDKEPSDWEQEYHNLGTQEAWIQDDMVRIVEYFIKKPETREIGVTPDGKTIEVIPGLEYVKTRTVKTHKVCRYVLTGHDVLEEEKEFPCKYIPVVPVFGPEEYIDGGLRPRSLVRYAKDPQRMYNFWQSTVAEKIALAPKSPWLVTPAMIAGLERYWNASNTENRAYLPYNPDPVAGAPQRQEPAYVNAAEIQQSAQAVDDLKATMGMYDASLGAQGNEQSGRAIIARQREGDTASFSWIDNLARSIQHTGRILIDMIPRIYDTQRIVRVLGADDTVDMVPINAWDEAEQRMIFPLDVGKYDVQITVGPSYATKRMEAADSMLQFIQAVPQSAQVAGDLIAKAMDWPGADDIAERLKKLLPPEMQEESDDPEERAALEEARQKAAEKEQIFMELEAAGKEAEIEAKKAQAEKTRADARAMIENLPMDQALKAAQIESAKASAAKALEDARAQDIENDAVESGVMELLRGQA